MFSFFMVVSVVVAAAAAPPNNNPCNVSLSKQTSHGMCIFGSTFGCMDATTMFVRNCSGQFVCGQTPMSVVCDSVAFQHANCKCIVPPPPPPAPPFVPTREPNMNGKYDLSGSPTTNTSKFPDFRDYPGGVQYFDVYSPMIVQRYSQVFWASLPPVNLPDNIIQEFDGRTMAVVGFEIDQVMKNDDGDISVPINVVYNHHFESTMAGANTQFEKVVLKPGETPQQHGGHGAPNNKETWVLRPKDQSKPLTQHSSAAFGGANGGEYRKSLHAYPPGNAQLIDSPHAFTLTPMQIDTWNRDKMAGPDAWNTSTSKFVPGPQPRTSLAPQSGPDAIYSGLLECPLTTRVRKVIQSNYIVQITGSCGDDLIIDTAAECFQAITKLVSNNTVTTNEVSNTSMATGCSIEHKADGGMFAIFNQAKSVATCGSTPTAVIGHTTSLVDLSVHLDSVTDTVTITMAGPSAVWFGVGFNASEMSDEPWAVIVDGTGAVTERKLIDQQQGTLLTATVTVVSNKVEGDTRTVVLTRQLKGASVDYYTFDVSGKPALPFINAVGSGPMFAYHKAKLPASLLLLPISSTACVCSGKPMPFGRGACKGVITYVPTNQTEDTGAGTVAFSNQCAPDPASQLLSQHNPTCDIRTYVGGQLSCHHMWSLLDADQAIPWVDQPLQYQMKFRFWYQRYTATPTPSHKTVTGGWEANLGAGGGSGLGAEFDVPKCDATVPGCSIENGTWVHTVIGVQRFPRGNLIAAHFHCHAPTCMSFSIANNDTGEVYCIAYPTYGGDNSQAPHAKDTHKFQEEGFIAVPPCLFGSAEFGLDPSPQLDGVLLRIVKRSNATYGHHGEMAHGQFYYAE
eukprot:m.96161 g.96161  ORF g.96161 m.96161 type:complete len:848 (-) comp26871_c0_seq2:157-2700(-)